MMMRRYLAILAVLGLLVGTSPSRAGEALGCPGIDSRIFPRGYQQLVVSTTAVGLTVPTGSDMAVIVVEDQPMRYRDDGTNPTSTVGTLRKADVEFVVCGNALDRVKFIRSGATDSNLSIGYYGR